MWATTSKFKCVAALKFATIMHRTSFEILRSCIRFRNCHNGDDEDMNRLNFVDDFVKAINEHRAKFLSMPDLICDDESMSRCHGTAITRRPADPWMQANRIICADSYFASVETARALANVGIRFIGVV
eukprot:IDg23174t1